MGHLDDRVLDNEKDLNTKVQWLISELSARNTKITNGGRRLQPGSKSVGDAAAAPSPPQESGAGPSPAPSPSADKSPAPADNAAPSPPPAPENGKSPEPGSADSMGVPSVTKSEYVSQS